MERCNFWRKKKAKTCFADKDLSSWTGLGRSGHVQITTFGPISHLSDSKLKFLTKFLDDSVWFLLENLKKHVFSTKNPNI